MSRKASGAPALANNPSDDICPVCKSNRYLNPSLTFLINPECYHRMCTSCVDRIFTSGPAPCPVAGCHKTLRKKGFHAAFFADLTIEREVDIRRRVHAVFNKREDDFETLRDWNNHLQDVEDLIFDLVEGDAVTKKRAEEKLEAYRRQEAGMIEERSRVEKEEMEVGRKTALMEREAARQRRLANLKAEEDEKMDLERSRREVLDKLASGEGDANEITAQAQRVVLKKAGRRRAGLAEAQRERDADISGLASGLSLRGLKRKGKQDAVEEGPYDPYGGMDFKPTRFVLQDDYDNEWLNGFKNQTEVMVAGYSLQEYQARAMFEAFSGLGVFVEEEVAARVDKAPAPPSVATAGASVAAVSKLKKGAMDSDDVF